MSLTSVKMSEDVWLTCLTHALSTETEEIMGLLLGDIQHSKNGSVTALIWGALPQPRSDRRKDRVETNPEQLTAASVQAEKMSVETGRTTRVIGWYHSHPHITVLPSHVDVRTQAMYQLLDTGFIGLIFSCFNEDVNKVGRIQVIAFQSLDGKQNHVSRPVSLSPVIDVELSVSSSENISTRSGSGWVEGLEQDTGDSRATAGALKGGGRSSVLGSFYANADANFLGRERTGGNNHTDIEKTVIDIDPMDMSESMQEAMHRSNLEMSGAEFVRREIPLRVLPTLSILDLDSPLTSFTDLQSVLYEEERTAYNQAIFQNIRDGKVHPLTCIHHTSTYQASMCKLMEYCLSPAISALQDRLKENEIRSSRISSTGKGLENTSSLIGTRPRVERMNPILDITYVEKADFGKTAISKDNATSEKEKKSLQRVKVLIKLAMLTEEAKRLEVEAIKGSESSSVSPRNISSHGHRGSGSFGRRDLYSSAESVIMRNVAGPGSRSRKGS